MQVSFTIPYTSSAIRATIVALNQMDNDLNSTGSLLAETPSIHVGTCEGGFNSQPATPAYREVPNSPTPPPPSVDEDDLAAPEGAVDSAGTPWDERIHSSSKTFLKSDGTWKLKKGVDKSLVAQVMAELVGNEQPVTSPMQNSANTPPPPVEVITEPETVTPPPPVSGDAFRQLIADIAKAGIAPTDVQATCMDVNGCTLPQCKGDDTKLSMLRMSLGL